jgi:hypothetical protein
MFVNDELEWMLKKAVKDYCKVSQHFPKGTEENHVQLQSGLLGARANI